MSVTFTRTLYTFAPAAPTVFATVNDRVRSAAKVTRTAMTIARQVGTDALWKLDVAWDNAWDNPIEEYDDGVGVWGEDQALANLTQCNGVWVQLAGSVPTTAAVSTPVDPVSGRLTLIQGDDHTSGDRLPSWSITNYNGPSLAGATGKLRVVAIADYQRQGADAAAALEVTANVSQGGTTVSVNAPVTAAQSGLLATFPPLDETTHEYQIVATTSGGAIVTLALGPATVKRRIKP